MFMGKGDINASLFQFLIGTLQTVVQLVAFHSSFLVSIPYRYATNLKAVAVWQVRYLFQFLIGTLQTDP